MTFSARSGAGAWRRLLDRAMRRRPKAALRSGHALDPAEAYRRWSSTYGEEPNVFQQLEAPVFNRLLGELTGKRVLDVGCGRGRVAQHALVQGARLSVAADLVLAMHVHARRSEEIHPARRQEPCRLVAPSHPLPFPTETFDVVACALVLGHVEDLTGALRAMAGVLRPGGTLVISDFHPFATLRGWQRTFPDTSSGTSSGTASTDQAIVQHLHTFGDYVSAFSHLGLVLEALEEPRFEDYPVAFVLRARKAR